MKTIITSFFLFLILSSEAQTGDFMWVPNDNSLVATYNSDITGVGFYVGGYIFTNFSAPYIYTTPASRFNRLGLSLSNHQVSIMGGVFLESFRDSVSFQPDLWFKIYPIRILTKTKKGLDLTLGINYMKEFRYAVGLSIPVRGIY